MNSLLSKRIANPVVIGLMVLAILLGKGLLFSMSGAYVRSLEAMLLVPLSIAALASGLVVATALALGTGMCDLFLMAKVAGLLDHPDQLLESSLPSSSFSLFLVLEIAVVIVAYVGSRRARAEQESSRQADHFMRRLYLTEKRRHAAIEQARSEVERAEEESNRFSSLALLLEGAARKLYTDLDSERFFRTLFRVLQESFGASEVSVYLSEPEGRAYRRVSSFGPRDATEAPEVVPADDPWVLYVRRVRDAVCVHDDRGDPETMEQINQQSALQVRVIGPLVHQEEVQGLICIHRTAGGFKVSPIFASMVFNIASVAFTNARLFEEIRKMADQDPLTHIYNRRYFFRQLEQLETEQEHRSQSYSVLMCDIDHFKQVNDHYGHEAGDFVLAEFARLCLATLGQSDLLARYGGEEFVVVLPGSDLEAGAKKAEAIRKAVQQNHFCFGNLDLRITISCGVASYPEHSDGHESLIHHADEALYRAKSRGRNRVERAEKKGTSQPGPPEAPGGSAPAVAASGSKSQVQNGS